MGSGQAFIAIALELLKPVASDDPQKSAEPALSFQDAHMSSETYLRKNNASFWDLIPGKPWWTVLGRWRRVD